MTNANSSLNISTWFDRFGCACKIMGEKLPTADHRRPQNNPHLKHSIEFLHPAFDYLAKNDISVFRLSSDLIPYATHPDYPELHWEKQLAEVEDDLVKLGDKARELNLRLSFHPSQFVVLSSDDDDLTKRSIEELRWQCRVLDVMGMPDNNLVFLHAGGAYGDYEKTRTRILKNIEALPEDVYRRFGLENDDVTWNASRVLDLCQTAEVPMVFDIHHHLCLNDGTKWEELLPQALATWNDTAKIHISSPKMDFADVKNLKLPQLRQHADFIDPFFMLKIIEQAESQQLPQFDIMLEAKAKDLAVLKLRKDLTKITTTAK